MDGASAATQSPEVEFQPLRELLATYMSEDLIQFIYSAYVFARLAHAGQMRASGEPYITHPLEAAMYLADLKLDERCIMAALLHDVIEDTAIDRTVLAEKFGEEVAILVDGVSKLTQIEYSSVAELEAENFSKMIMAMGKDIRVILVKLADRLHNMRTIQAVAPAKRRRKGLETLEIYAPIANRLGIHSLYTEFDDLGFAAIYPMRYRILKHLVEKQLLEFTEIRTALLQVIQSRLDKHNIPIRTLAWHSHHLYSIYCKMRDKRLSLHDILETLPLRLVVPDLDTCYRALGVMHNLFKPNLEHFKDYIAIPKANGYRALHTMLLAKHTGREAIRIELQIRSQNMQNLAEYGIVAHWQQKTETKKLDRSRRRAQAWLDRLLEMHQNAGTPQEFVDTVKKDLFPEEIYVFTPKGKILALPPLATPVDFAYHIHSDIGHHCVAAKINRRLAPLSTPLSNGQTIEIITEPQAKPNPDWLNFVVTGRARTQIRQYLKSLQRSEAIILGQDLLAQALLSFHQTLAQITVPQWTQVLQALGYKTREDLAEAIGLGNAMAMIVARHLLGHFSDQSLIPEVEWTTPIYIKGSGNLVVSFAECCYPIPGDPIVALFTPGKGLVVHQEQCHVLQNTPALLNQAMHSRWEENLNTEFTACILLDVANKRGMLAKLAATIAEAQVNIEDIKFVDKSSPCYRVQLLLSVRDRVHLAQVIRKLRNMKDVMHITRLR